MSLKISPKMLREKEKKKIYSEQQTDRKYS